MKTDYLVHIMLTTSTGTHMLDSGGEIGRHWQRNQNKTLADFKAEPEAVLDWYCKRDDDGNIIDAHPEVTVSLFHKLTSGIIWQDDLCREFNAMPCHDWRGHYCGISSEQSEWLDMRGFVQPHEYRHAYVDSRSDGWNTYNWENNFSQVIQGHNLELEDAPYVLIQIHNGADVRGGYTDAKLFRLADYTEHHAVLTDDCFFSVENAGGENITLDWHGEWLADGTCASNQDILDFAKACDGNAVTGHQNNDY